MWLCCIQGGISSNLESNPRHPNSLWLLPTVQVFGGFGRILDVLGVYKHFSTKLHFQFLWSFRDLLHFITRFLQGKCGWSPPRGTKLPYAMFLGFFRESSRWGVERYVLLQAENIETYARNVFSSVCVYCFLLILFFCPSISGFNMTLLPFTRTVWLSCFGKHSDNNMFKTDACWQEIYPL